MADEIGYFRSMEMQIKERVIKTIQALPDDATMDDVLERVLFMKELDRRLAGVHAGNYIPDEAVDEKLKKWLIIPISAARYRKQKTRRIANYLKAHTASSIMSKTTN